MSFIQPFALESRAPAPVTNYTQAYSLIPSQVWDGNDGAWSSFVIRVGTPAQYFRIIPSTNGAETWVPVADHCDRGIAWCGNARGVEPFNSGNSGPMSGAPSGQTLGSLDAGFTCTANKSPMCTHCVSVNGKCTDGPCAGRTCCGDPPGQCNSGGCNGISGICTGAYIGCPCPGPDYNAGTAMGSASATAQAPSPLLAEGFMWNQSTSWVGLGNHWATIGSGSNQSVSGQYGTDTVGIGADPNTGLTLDASVVAGLPAQPFYLGELGLLPSNSTGPNKNTSSFLQQLATQKKIPSVSYGYTAGALYRQQPSLGSLTLGGYDASRFVPNSVSFNLASTSIKVPIKFIQVAESLVSGSPMLLSDPISATIDTTTPHMWLPLPACQAFENAFGLHWDNSTQLYLVNDTAHQQLQNQNPHVTFSLGPDASSDTVNISLPYAAFDLQASSPIFANGTNYFPLRRATDPSQYSIGRAFFQEAYITVDYELGNFSLAQTTYPFPNNTEIVTINHHVRSGSLESGSSSGNLTTGSIAGIAVGVSMALLLIFLAGLFCFKRKRATQARKARAAQLQSSPPEHKRNMSNSTDQSAAPPYMTQIQHNTPGAGTGFSPGGDTLMGNAGSPPFGQYNHPLFGSPKGLELEDPTSPAAAYVRQQQQQLYLAGYGVGYPYAMAGKSPPMGWGDAKPLPRTPQELPGDDPVTELMQKRDSSATAAMGGVGGTRSPQQHYFNAKDGGGGGGVTHSVRALRNSKMSTNTSTSTTGEQSMASRSPTLAGGTVGLARGDSALSHASSSVNGSRRGGARGRAESDARSSVGGADGRDGRGGGGRRHIYEMMG